MTHVLYLMRHGIAEDLARGMRDEDRALTAEGIRKTKRVAAGLAAAGVRPDVVLTSPLRRAAQTARIAADVLGCREVVTYQPLAAGARPADILAGLRQWRQAGAVLLVGHQPDLGDLASYLLTGSADTAPLPFKKAAVAAITVAAVPPRATGVLEWFLTPGQLRAIAEGSNRADS